MRLTGIPHSRLLLPTEEHPGARKSFEKSGHAYAAGGGDRDGRVHDENSTACTTRTFGSQCRNSRSEAIGRLAGIEDESMTGNS